MAESTRRLLIVFTVLLLATAVWSVAQKRRTTSRERSFGRVDVEDVVKIEITGQGKEVMLEHHGGRWMLTEPLEYPANQTAVEDLLEKTGELAVVNLVSSNPGNHDLYEVGHDTGMLVRLFGGRDGNRELFAYYVGKMTSDFNHTYVREFGQNDVYTATGLLSGYVDKEVGAWRDRTILDLPLETIQEVHAAKDSIEYVLARRGRLAGAPDTPWTVLYAGDSEPVEADSSQAVRIARKLASLSASGFPVFEGEVSVDWEEPLGSLRVVMTDGSSHEVRIWEIPDDQNRFYVRRDAGETVFLMYRSNLDLLWQQREDLAVGESGDPGSG